MKSWIARVALILCCVVSSAWLAWPESEADTRRLHGLWERTDLAEPDDVRYYYFHPNGLGLYRFGKTALNYTHMFRYELRGAKLKIRFLRSGERASTRIAVNAACPYGHASTRGEWLTLESDPREQNRRVRYRKRTMSAELGPDEQPHDFARMWMHEQRVTGRSEFAIYQFQRPDRKGRGRGWFHRGDYDEWSTESLSYERTAQGLRLKFDLGGAHDTPILERKCGNRRSLILARDPRNYWHQQTYVDRGPSFATARSEELRWRFLDELQGSAASNLAR